MGSIYADNVSEMLLLRLVSRNFHEGDIMQHDPLVDVMTGLKNAEQSGKNTFEAKPSSKLIGRILNVMQSFGYIKQFEYIENGRGGAFNVTLLGAINQCGAIRPRFAVKKEGFEKFESRYQGPASRMYINIH